jgi:competence protein ComEA
MQMPKLSRGRALAYCAVVLVFLAVGGRFLLDPGAAPRDAVEAAASAGLEVEPAPPRRLVVHVVGAVRRPGLYELEEGSRVAAAIELAGGVKSKAALELVNLAAPVADGQQIVVPTRLERAELASAHGGIGPPTGGPVRLNSATLDELDSLPGVGPVTAQKILDYREKNGGFRTLDELDAIPGIGPARLEQLREVVQL